MEAARQTEVLISATSTESFEDALQQGIARAGATLRGVQEVRVRDQRMVFENGNITGYQVNLIVVFEAEAEAGGASLGVMLDPAEFQRLREAAEELEDLRAYDEALEELSTGEDILVPWEKAQDTIAGEREILRRRGEL